MEITFTISPAESGKRIDVLCAEKHPEMSRSRWQKYGRFNCEDVAKPAKTKTQAGENWTVSCEPEQNEKDLEPWDHRLKIWKDTDDYAVIEKPYGIAVHPSISDNSQKTIVNALVHQFGAQLSENFDEIEGRQIPRPGLVHRLDKTTSGLLLVAKNNASHRFFQDHWSEFTKVYECVVQGKTPEQGTIESGITRDPQHRQRMTAANNEKSKWAITDFQRIEDPELPANQSRLRVTIHTGRTHQIRVHLSSVGFPIIGDQLYGGPKAERVKLHATKLQFLDPKTSKPVVIESPVGF